MPNTVPFSVTDQWGAVGALVSNDSYEFQNVGGQDIYMFEGDAGVAPSNDSFIGNVIRPGATAEIFKEAAFDIYVRVQQLNQEVNSGGLLVHNRLTE